MQPETVFSALSHPVRLGVLSILLEGDRTAGALAQQFELSRSAVSEHLGILRQAELVRERKSGRERYYSLNGEPLEQVRQWLVPYENYWKARLGTLAQQLEDEQ